MSQPARRMNSELSATISLLASGVLHGLLVFGLVRSASGAERAWDELDPARFAGNTFEIDTVDAAALSADNPAAPAVPEAPSPPKAAPVAPEAKAAEPEAPNPEAAAPSAPEPAAPSPEVSSTAADAVSASSAASLRPP